MEHNTRKYQLRMLGLPEIRNFLDFSNEIHISESAIKKYVAYAQHYYFTYEIPKKSGGVRLIAQPNRELKAIQSWILRHILDKLFISDASKGFQKGESIYDNAYPHIGANVILALDIDNFFPSIPANKVFWVFRSVGYGQKISSAFTSICTYKGSLPQGSPASPKIANLVCLKLDARIQGYAGKNGITYTRYADDISLSCQSIKKMEKARYVVQKIIKDENFLINKKKTRLMGLRKKKEVTGLVINQEKAVVGRHLYRILRAKIHHLFVGRSDNFSHVNGWLAFVYGVDNEAYRKLEGYIKSLKEKYPLSSARENIWIKK